MPHDDDQQGPPLEDTAAAPPRDGVTPEQPETAPVDGGGRVPAQSADADPTVQTMTVADVMESGPSEPIASEHLVEALEALVFASPEPITPRQLFKLLDTEPKEDVETALRELQARYEARGGGLQLVHVAGGYQIVTRPELADYVRRMFHERTTQKLSVQALETLAVIAYKQPITAAEITEIRGVNTSGVLATLLERHLVKIVGRKNVVGRPFLYATTKEFLIRFGLNDLNDLPKIEDMAQQLGFDPPPVLMERPVPEEMLPLEEGDIPEGSQ